uniref:Uncharacterized protein n=1 Tax=Ditylenchus dipsaci TaxID=166011 RepID=A0A915ERT6_9BILA
MSIRSALQEINAGYFSDSDEEEEVEDGEPVANVEQSPMRNQSPLWSHRTLDGSHRTNNYAEAANHRIQTELDVCHPGYGTLSTACEWCNKEETINSSSGKPASDQRKSDSTTKKLTPES